MNGEDCHYRPYAIPCVTTRKTDSGRKSGYYAAILSDREDCSLWSLGHSKLLFSFWSFLHNVGGRMIKTTGLCLTLYEISAIAYAILYAAVVSESSPAAR